MALQLLRRFNSKMVRLKDSEATAFLFFFDWFQFQNGAIKRVFSELKILTAISFQFQNGAIKSLYSL